MLQLGYPLTTSIDLNGTNFEVDLMYDNVLKLHDMLRDEEIGDPDKVITGLIMLIGDELEEYDIQDRATIFTTIYNESFKEDTEKEIETDIEGNPMPSMSESDEQTYDLAQDADYIFASFYQDYGIDLHDMHGKLHWAKFKALLGGLKKDTRFKEVLEIRQMPLPTGKGSSKERESIKKLKRQYALKGVDIVEYEEDDEDDEDSE